MEKRTTHHTRKKRSKPTAKTVRTTGPAVGLRIIGGRHRGRRLDYLPRLATRPMKDRVREAIFNLVGSECRDRHAIDLFAGTGAVGLEAISRGAATATLIERHVPTGRVLRGNIERLDVGNQSELLLTSAFLWAKRDLPALTNPGIISRKKTSKDPSSTEVWPGSLRPWIAFVCPPYDFYITQEESMLALVQAILQYAPAGSILVVEADRRFDFTRLPSHWGGQDSDTAKQLPWDIRSYPPAVIGILRDSGDVAQNATPSING